MRIVVINPNTTASMTERIGQTARAVAHAGTQVVALNPLQGPASIEGFVDEALSVPGMLEAMANQATRHPETAGYLIACFDDTGLDAARCLVEAPVIGIGEAACHVASLLAVRFSVITTLSRSVAALEHNLVKYGLSSRCAKVRAAEVAVLALEDPASQAYARISAEIADALQHDGAEAIVLGCAGMTDLAKRLSQEHNVPVIDGVAAGVKLLEGLGALGLKTSKLRSYAPPLPKAYAGIAPSFFQNH